MSLAASAISAPSKKSNLKVLDVQFEPIRQGKNVVRVKVENASEDEQIFRIQIYTRSPDYGRQGVGWGTSFFETIKGRETRWTRFAFKIQGPITRSTYVRLDFHNPGPAAGFDREKYFEDKGRKKWFKRVKYSSRDIEHYKADEDVIQPVSEKESEAVIQAFRQIQNHIRDKEYKRAWELFTKDYQDAEFQLPGFEKFKQIMEPEKPIDSAFWWQKAEFLSLQPGPVLKKGPVLALTAKHEDEVWAIDFVEEGGRWKIDWVAGYTPGILTWQNWEEHLLPKMEKRSTEHFDIYYFKDSTAEKQIDRIMEEKEKSYAGICEFVGKDSDVRIRTVLFEDKETKHWKTGHQGAGWAYGNTIVEVYNEQEQVDPYHETTHILMGSSGNPPALFNEGFATYMQAGHIWKGEHVDRTAANLLKNDKLTPLRELITRTEIGSRGDDGKIAYPQSASFVKFLIDEYGRDKFLRAYKKLKNSDNEKVHKRNVKRLARIYGKSLEELEKQWKDALLRSEPGRKAGGDAAREYEVTIPEEWKPYVSVGKLRVLGPPFYGVIKPRRPLVPLVRINWSLKNLTSDNLDTKVNYWSRMTTDKWKTGFGVPYKLGPKEERTIDNIYPVVSAQKPVQFGIRMVRLQAAGGTELLARHNGIITGVLPVSPPAADNLVVKEEENAHWVLQSRKLMYSQERGNRFVAEVTNRTNQERPLVVYAAVRGGRRPQSV
jgi:hypothetical protein